MVAVVIELTCGHIYEINERPRVDEPCREGCGIRVVVNEWPEQWHSRCTLCSYVRGHGFSKKYAEEAATTHVRTTGHRVSVLWYSDAPAEIRTRVQAENLLRLRQVSAPKPAVPPF